MKENHTSFGYVRIIKEHDTGQKELIEFPNTILATGTNALASCLARNIGDSFNFYINRMLFGDGGTVGGTTLYVATNRNGLFGITQASKPVIATVNPSIPSQVTFTSVVAFSEANGAVLNEMALQMATGDFYSMVTFPNLTKTSNLQFTINWEITLL